MKLATQTSYIVKNPPPGFGGRYFIFVTLTTSCGITGTGEIYAASFAPEVITAMASDIFQRYLEGQNPFQIEQFCRRAHGSGFSHRPDPSLQGVVSGLEMACWDIIGKALDRPVYDLLGGQVHDRLRTYTYLYPRDDQDAGHFYNDPVASAEAALSYVKQGFTAVKFDPAGQYTVFDGRMPDLPALDRSAAFCAAIRDAVGDQADLLFGTHGQFTAAGAIRLAERLARYDPLWLEEPTPPDMPEEMAKVAAATTVPIATGENLQGLGDFTRLIDKRAASILNLPPPNVGGLTEARKIATLAEMRGMQIAPHFFNYGPLNWVAMANLCMATPNVLILEANALRENPSGPKGLNRNQFFKEPIQFDGYYFVPSGKPGLGYEYDEKFVVSRKRLA